MKEIVVTSNDSGQRLDRFLVKAFPRFSQGLIQKAIRQNNLKINRKRVPADYHLVVGDVLQIYLPDDLFASSERPIFLGACSDISVVYEDPNILIVDKPTGLVVHEDNAHSSDTLISRIITYLIENGSYDPADSLSFCPALCNRIDRNTSGLVIAAKTAEALRIITEKIRLREIDKFYLAVLVGEISPKEATHTAFLQKIESENRVIVTDTKSCNNKTIITKYKVIDSFRELSLVEVELLTGRTHQIRAHFAHLGYPLLGDGKYGINRTNRHYGVKTQALCSYRLCFAFKSDAGTLNYLDGQTFTAASPLLQQRYYDEKQKFSKKT